MEEKFTRNTNRLAQTGKWLIAAGLVVVLLVSVSEVASQQKRAQLPDPKDKWLRIETANFTIYSSASEREAAKIGVNLERLRQTLTLLTSEAAVNAPIPTLIFLFENDKSFEPYIFHLGGKTASLAGYFLARPDGNYIAMSAEREAVHIIYHEYLHFFIINNFPNVPLWYNEGFAEAYAGLGETYVYDPKSKVDEGITALETALRKLPSRMDIAVNLLVLYARNDDSTNVRGLLENVIRRRANAAVISNAEEQLMVVELQKAHEMLKKGRNRQAISILDRIAPLARRPGLVKQIKDMRRAAEQNRQADIYSRAMVKANLKKFDEAIALLEQVIEIADDAKLRQSAKDMLKEVRFGQQVEWYNEAMSYLKAEDFKKAEPLLARIVESPVIDPKLTKAAKDALNHVRRVLRKE